jgi:hypothetical protein
VHKGKKSETTKLLESKRFVAVLSQAMDRSDHLNSPFEISEIPKTLVLHTLAVYRRHVLWFVRPLKRVDNFQE